MLTRTLALVAALFLVLAPSFDALAKSSGGGSRGSFSSGGSRGSSSGWSSSSKPSGSSSGTGSSSGWSSGSGSSSGSSSSSSGSSSGWSTTNRQASPAPSSQGTAPSGAAGAPSSGWSNSSGASQSSASKPGAGSAFSSAGSDAVKRQGAAASYKDYQSQFGKSGNAVSGSAQGERPLLNPNRTFNSYGDYNRYRDNYYAGRGWSAPGYAFGSFSSFGMWDAMFMWFMLSHLSGPSFFYNHQSDPGVQAFQKEAQRLSESNADLKKQVEELNTKLDDMKKSGVQPDPAKPLPADVDPDVAVAKPKIAEAAEKSSGGGWLLPATAGLAALLAIGYFMTRRRSA